MIHLLPILALFFAAPTAVGDSSCRTCHAAQVDSFHRTNHYLTSSEPTAHSILGSFTPPDNLLKTGNPSLTFHMEAKPKGFYQTANARSERFDLVIGSGEKGQTYLFWDDDQLFELPVSYWKDLGWVNSPGYRDGVADFGRAIIPRCLECHATSFQSTAPPTNSYNRAHYELGVQCEKCHGPGSEHVQHEQAKSQGGPGILNPGHFSRERQMDLCAWCHGGHGESLLPSFSYVPGEALEKYIRLSRPDPAAPVDVHGNQVDMLKQSRCYAQSSMTCLTCHNVHVAQHDLAAFSQRCLGCHQPGSATFARPDHRVVADCISCHMPKQQTNLIVFNSMGKQQKPEMRNHWIRVYPPGMGSHTDTPQNP
jgi:Cytochrome c554 and c-prime